ncbi:hypothetical protein [Streptomyces sp. TR02-1]|uniref:hypothetical protein n=1 Tax=Streptomyces sp. TR02-1 TaxID=3385977 RepID=UPI00399EF80B
MTSQTPPGDFTQQVLATAQNRWRHVDPAANLSPSTTVYAISRSGSRGLIWAAVRSSFSRLMHHGGDPETLAQRLSCELVLHTGRRRSFLLPAPSSLSGPWDQAFAAVNDALSKATGFDTPPAAPARLASTADRLLQEHPDTPQHLPPLRGKGGEVAVAAHPYDLDGVHGTMSAIAFPEGPLFFSPNRVSPALSRHETELDAARRALRLARSWDRPVTALLLPPLLVLDVHAVLCGEAPPVVAAMRGIRHSELLRDVASELSASGAELRTATTDREVVLMRRASRAACLAACFTPAEPSECWPLMEPLMTGSLRATVSAARAAARTLGHGRARVVPSRDHSPGTPSKPGSLAVRKLIEQENTHGTTTSGRPVVSVDASVQGKHATCAVVLPDGAVLTADLTGHLGPDPVQCAEHLAVLLGLAHAPYDAVIACDNDHAVLSVLRQASPSSRASEVDELRARAAERSDCSVVWRRRNSTPGLIAADHASRSALEALRNSPPPLSAAAEIPTSPERNTPDLRRSAHVTRAGDN